jgi:(p)ppGpp synthase/HD superfamily hydrolase
VVHADQRRRSGAPFVAHPVSAASLVYEAGLGEEAVAAALLHDVIEDTQVSIEEIEERFGSRVAELVAALTENPAIDDYERRKEAHRAQVEAAGPVAAAVYAADKLSNIRDMRDLYERDGERIAPLFKAPIDVRFRLWLDDAEMVGRVAPDLPYLSDLRVELDSLQALRARGGVRAAAES